MSSRYSDFTQLRDKIEWEGGIEEFLTGCGFDARGDLPGAAPDEVKELAAKVEHATKEFGRLAEQFYEAIDALAESEDADEDEENALVAASEAADEAAQAFGAGL